MLRLSLLTAVGLLATQGTAASVKRQGTIKPFFDDPEAFYDHDAGTPDDCTMWWNSDDGISCETAILIAGITEEQLTYLVSLFQSTPRRCLNWDAFN